MLDAPTLLASPLLVLRPAAAPVEVPRWTDDPATLWAKTRFIRDGR